MADKLVKFKYAGSKVRLDIEVTAQELITAAEHLIDDLALLRSQRIRDGLTQSEANAEVLYLIKNSEGAVKAFENKQNRVIAKLTNELVARPVNAYAQANPKAKFDWVLGSVKTSHCPDCIRLASMKPRTVSGWEKLGYGLPGQGKTECSWGCKCQLIEVGE